MVTQLITQRISKLFQGLDRAHSVFNITHSDNGKVKGSVFVKHEPVTLDLWKDHLDGISGLGIIPITDNASAKWGAIDIDDISIDHKVIEKKIQEHKLPLVLCRSKSGGAHLFIFAKDFINAQDIRAKLEELAIGLGFNRAEIFPKQSKLASKQDTGNALNMPYFGILGENKTTLRYCVRDGKAIQDVNEFITYAELKRITAEELRELTIETKEEFKDAPPCLQYLTRVGFTSHYNNALFSLGVFARKKYSDSWEDKVEKYNIEYMKPGTSKEVQNVIKGLKKKSYYYKCNDEPLVNHCSKVLCRKCKYGIGDDYEMDIDLSIMIDGIQKLKTIPPIWYLNVLTPDGSRCRLEIDDTEKLMTQRTFNIKCVEQLNMLPPFVKQAKWHSFISTALLNIEEIEAPQEASADGILFNQLQEFLTGKVQAKSKEELKLGKPWYDAQDNTYYFKSDSFYAYIIRRAGRWFSKWKPAQLYAKLRSQGIAPVQMFNVGNVWKIEASKFDSILKNEDIPDINIETESDTPF
ncbi:MAG: hypothetical protein OEY10_00290 [Nitrosopumilus sp.]|nr:hypothetical protein [Nitrosopumilus sp.]